MKKKLRIMLIVIGSIFTLWFMLPVFTGFIVNIGNMTGIAVFASVAVYGMKMESINKLIAKLWQKKCGKIILKFAATLMSVTVCVTIIISSLMIATVFNVPTDETPTLIVLGCRVYDERASLMLSERLDAAYEYLSQNEDVICIVSGGQGEGENISEAECMYRYLVDLGIDESRIYKEDQSTSTRENLLYSKQIIEDENLSENIAIVTNEFHEFRAKLIADELDLDSTSVSAATAWWLFPTYYVRELYGIIYQVLF